MATGPITTTISVNQLCVGLYVHLDVGWLDHSFVRNNFKIKNEAQIETIKRMGFKTVRAEPRRSDCRPLPLVVDETPIGAVLEPSAEELEIINAKKARIARIMEERAAIAKCEKEFVKAANTLKNISRNLFSRPQDARQDADQLIQQMLESLMADKNIAIHLMNDKIAGEEAYFHSLNVAVLAMMLGKELSLPPEDIKLLGIGCLFHDIGKIEIPDRVVNKTFPLTRPEQNLLQQHCHYGKSIGETVGLPAAAIDIILQHHEHADGSGYPGRLPLARISRLARIVCIVNTYDNHCNRPNPSDSLSPYEALCHMFAVQSKYFDPAPLNVFIRCMGVYPPGTIVKLSDGTLGMVISINSGKPLRPVVVLYDPNVPKNEAILLDLSVELELEVSASLKPRQLPPEVYDYLSPRKRISYFSDTPKPASSKA